MHALRLRLMDWQTSVLNFYVQASLKYNVPESEDLPVFDIIVDVRKRRSVPDEESTQCSPLRLDITAK